MRLFSQLIIAACCAVICSISEAWSPFDGCKEEIAARAMYVDHLQPIPRINAPALPSRCESYFLWAYAVIDTRQWCMTAGTNGTYQLVATDRREGGKAKDPVVVNVSQDTGEIIQAIWINAVQETRFPCLDIIQADGVTYYFGFGFRDAYTTAPFPAEDLPPKWLVGAGEEILGFTDEKDRDESKLRQSLLKTRDKLFAYYQKNGRH